MSRGPLPDARTYTARVSLLVNALGAFLLAGAALVFWKLELFSESAVGTDPLFPAILALLALLCFARAGLKVDRPGRRVLKYWGFHVFTADVPVWSTEVPFDALSEAIYTQRVEESRNSKGHTSYRTIFPLRLRGPEADILVEDFAFEDRARATGESLSRMIGLPLCNATGTEPSVRSPEELDIPLRERLLAAGRPPAPPEIPERLRAGFRRESGAVSLAFPPRPIEPLEFVFFLVILGAAAAFAFSAPAYRWVAVLAAALALGAAAAALARERVTVSRGGIAQWKGLFGLGLTRRLDAGELEELVIGLTKIGWGGLQGQTPRTDPVVRAISDRSTLELGRGLTRPELDTLRALILSVIAEN